MRTKKIKLFKNKIIDYLAVFLLRVIAFLPWRAITLIGTIIGYFMCLFPNKNKYVATIQINKCFAHLGQTEINKLIKKSLINIGRNMLENICSVISHPNRSLKLIDEIHGLDELNQALKSDKAVVCLTSHLGNWEILNHFYGSLCNSTCFYRPLKKFKRLDTLIKNARTKNKNTVVPSTKRGILTIMKQVKAGAAVGIPIDPEPSLQAGIFVPFLGVQTLTSKFAHTLLTNNNACGFFMHAIRKKNGSFAIYIEPAPSAMYDQDATTATHAMSQVLEKYITLYPEQYLWSMKRFKNRPNNEIKWY